MSFTGKWISVSVLLPFLVAGTTAEEAKKTDRESNSLISRIRKNHKEDAATDRLNSSFLPVRSPDGRGSAFLVRLWEQPVIVTNAHSSLGVIRALDYPALVKRCKESR